MTSSSISISTQGRNIALNNHAGTEILLFVLEDQNLINSDIT